MKTLKYFFVIGIGLLTFVINANADNKSGLMLVTNLPCKLDVAFTGTTVAPSGKTNAVIQYTVSTKDNKTYYLVYLPDAHEADFKIYSMNQGKRINELLFPEPPEAMRFFSGRNTNDPNNYRILSNRPYTRELKCPLDLLENAEYGLVGVVTIREDDSNVSTNSTDTNFSRTKIQILTSAPFEIKKK